MKSFQYNFIIMPRGPSYSQTSLRLYADGDYHKLPILQGYQSRSPTKSQRRTFDPYVKTTRLHSNYKANNDYEVFNDYRPPKTKTRISKGCQQCEVKLNDDYMMSAQIKSSKKIRRLKTDVQLLKEKIQNLQRIDSIRQQQIDRIRIEMYYVKMDQVESLSAKLLEGGKCKHKKRFRTEIFRDTAMQNQEVSAQQFKTFTNLPQIPSVNSLPAFGQTERKPLISRQIKSTYLQREQQLQRDAIMRPNDLHPRQSRKNEAVNPVSQNQYNQYQYGNRKIEPTRSNLVEQATVLENQITHFSPSESVDPISPVCSEEDKKPQIVFKGSRNSVEVDYIREADNQEIDTVRTQSNKTAKVMLSPEKVSRTSSKQLSSNNEPSQISSDYFKNRPIGHIKILEEEGQDQFQEKEMRASDVVGGSKSGLNPSDNTDEKDMLHSEVPYDYSMTSSIFVPKKSPQLKRIDLLTSVNSINFDMQHELESNRPKLLTQSNHPSLSNIHDIKFIKI